MKKSNPIPPPWVRRIVSVIRVNTRYRFWQEKFRPSRKSNFLAAKRIIFLSVGDYNESARCVKVAFRCNPMKSGLSGKSSSSEKNPSPDRSSPNGDARWKKKGKQSRIASLLKARQAASSPNLAPTESPAQSLPKETSSTPPACKKGLLVL